MTGTAAAVLWRSAAKRIGAAAVGPVGLHLHSGSARPPEVDEHVSVLIPVRHEPDPTLAAVRAALGQLGIGHLDIVVLDDGCPQETRAALRQEFGDDPRVRILAAAPLPRGWSPRAHRSHQLAVAARGRILIFAEPSAPLGPHAAASVTALLRAEHLDLAVLDIGRPAPAASAPNTAAAAAATPSGQATSTAAASTNSSANGNPRDAGQGTHAAAHANQPNAVQPQAARRRSARPDDSRPSSNQPDSAQVDGAQSQAARRRNARPDGSRPSSSQPDGAQADGMQSQAARRRNARPDDSRPGSNQPDGAQADGAPPGAARRRGARPDSSRSSSNRPEGAQADGAQSQAAARRRSARPDGSRPSSNQSDGAQVDGARSQSGQPHSARPHGVRSHGVRLHSGRLHPGRFTVAVDADAYWRTGGYRAAAEDPDPLALLRMLRRASCRVAVADGRRVIPPAQPIAPLPPADLSAEAEWDSLHNSRLSLGETARRVLAVFVGARP